MIEDGKTLLYNVYKNGKIVGEFKSLYLGVEQIKRTCESWNLNIDDYEIRLKSDDSLVWSQKAALDIK
jgi:hypothetical protein